MTKLNPCNPEQLHRPECIKQNNRWTRQAHSAKMEEGEMIKRTFSVTKERCSLQQGSLTHLFWNFQPYQDMVSSWGDCVGSVILKLYADVQNLHDSGQL